MREGREERKGGIARTAKYELLMSYIEEDKMGGMAANIFISATTGLPEGCTPMTQLPLSHSIKTTTLIDSQLVAWVVKVCFSLTDGTNTPIARPSLLSSLRIPTCLVSTSARLWSPLDQWQLISFAVWPHLV